MNKWILNPTQVDFNAGTATPLNWGVPFPYRVENAAYDASGNLMFYIQNMTVYNPNGTAAGNLPQGFSLVTGYTYWDILHEIAIAPIPGSCNQYYIIYCLNRGFVGNALKHAIITVNANGTLTISTDMAVLAQNSGNSGAIAVSPDDGTGRQLYWVSGNGGVFKYNITAAGIIPVSTLVAYAPSDPQGKKFQAKEAEVVGTSLIWVENDAVFQTSTVNSTELPLTKYTMNKRTFWGIEFDDNAGGFYLSTETNINGVITGGIYHFLFSTINPVLVTNTTNYTRTLIEQGKDGLFYAVNRNGVLGRFVGNGPAAGAFNNLLIFSDNSNSLWSGPYYKLPDQIDRENYDNFSGVAPLNITGMQINGAGLVDAVPPPPPVFYDCNPISLNVFYTGAFCDYTIQIYSVDPATGNQLFGAQYLNFSTTGSGPLPSPINLKTIGGTANLFANYLGQTFAIRISGSNCCGQSDVIKCYFRVFGAPAPAAINLQVNPGTGNPCPASHSIASPCPASIYSASLNMGNSQGDIDYYFLKIDEVDCMTGNVISTIYTEPPVTVSGASQLTAIGLNDKVINGNAGYFVDKCCRCYRIEATIGNECGSSTDYTYIKFTLPNCNCFSGGSGGEERNTIGNNAPTGNLHLAPNPVTDFIQFFPADENSRIPVSRGLTIFGPQGSVALRLDNPDLRGPIQVHTLPAGVYYYLLETESEPVSGKFVKL